MCSGEGGPAEGGVAQIGLAKVGRGQSSHGQNGVFFFYRHELNCNNLVVFFWPFRVQTEAVMKATGVKTPHLLVRTHTRIFSRAHLTHVGCVTQDYSVLRFSRCCHLSIMSLFGVLVSHFSRIASSPTCSLSGTLSLVNLWLVPEVVDASLLDGVECLAVFRIRLQTQSLINSKPLYTCTSWKFI